MSDREDMGLVLLLAGGGGCSLDSSPGKNWVENSGGLPDYICRIAKSISKGGKSKSAAIAIAVSRVKAWAAGGDDVDADTRAKAGKAVAEWEALKAKNKARKVVKASRIDGSGYLQLSNTDDSFNTEIVKTAWRQATDEARKYARAQAKAQGLGYDSYESVPYSYIRELWTDYIIVEVEGNQSNFLKVPFTVSGNAVSFGDPTAVKVAYVPVESIALSSNERQLLGSLLTPPSVADQVRALMQK
jgi:hypothetical protein